MKPIKNENDLIDRYNDEDSARELIESIRWADGVICPHCSEMGAYKLKAKPTSKSPGRKGLWKCRACRKQFTVKVGSIFEDSHIPLHLWVRAMYKLCSSKKGMSAHQLHRSLGITYKSAWFMFHRIRFAMERGDFGKMSGTIECDETYVGGRRRMSAKGDKAPVFALVERNGDVRSFHVERVTAENLVGILKQNVKQSSHIVTDGLQVYNGVGARFKRHDVINHAQDEYARTTDDGFRVHTNTIEGFFGILKRGINGIYHQVGKHHLHRYLSEFDFRYNSRKLTDGQRTIQAIKGASGKRLVYRDLPVAVN